MVKLSTIAGWVGAEAPEAEVEIDGVSGIEDATPSSVVFATEPKLLTQALGSSAGAILSDRRQRRDVPDRRVLWVDDPKLAFAQIAHRLRAPSDTPAIHPTALIEDGARVGEGSRIGPGAIVSRGVTMGADCEILANVTVYPGTSLGDRVVVQSGAVLGSTGFGYVRDSASGSYIAFPQQGTLSIEDDVEIGANTTIDRGALGETRIGRGTKIDNLVHIGHNCIVGEDVIIAAQTGISGSTTIGRGAVIGGQVGIGDHAVIGEQVILGSGSGVLSQKKLRGPGEVFWGIPAQPLKQYLRDLARVRRGR